MKRHEGPTETKPVPAECDRPPGPRPSRPPWLPDLLLALIPAALAIFTWLIFLTDRAPHTSAALDGFPLDDAWIHMVYGRALAFEGGFNYNTGVPEAGMTSPLWVLLLAGVHAGLRGAGIARLVLGAKVLALLFGLAGAWLLAALSRALGLSRGGALLAASLFALDPSLTFSRAAGMEVPLFTALMLLSLLMAVRSQPVGTGAAIGMAIVARPEGVVLVPALALILLGGRWTQRPHISRYAIAALLGIVPGMLEMAYCLHTTGSLLPNTFYAKFSGHVLPSWEALGVVWRNYVIHNLPYFTFGMGSWLAILGGWRLLRRAPRVAGGTLAAGVLLFACTVGSRVFSPGHFHYWERWIAPTFPILLLAIAAGIEAIVQGMQDVRGRSAPGARGTAAARSWPRAALLAAGGLALIVILAPWARVLVARADEFAWNCQNIDELDVACGQWVGGHLPLDAVVATCDAGAVRYFGNRITVDLAGLNDHRILAARRTGAAARPASYKVRWLILFPGLFRELLAAHRPPVLFSVHAPHYTISGAAQDTLEIYAWNPQVH